ncbi:hypothetical protein [Ruminococcus sp.]|uniref:hypothetical protein n=1 Tax=Ruminococcus sp. TaxID=41978 RepID=UPI003FD82D99
MITKDDILKAAEICTMGGDHGELCPNCPLDNEKAACVLIFAEYIKETEPAPAATGTSSEVVSKDTNSTHLDNSTKEQICQAYDTADKACADILDIYEGMSECEQRAFDIGEVYGKICSTRDKLENMRGAN